MIALPTYSGETAIFGLPFGPRSRGGTVRGGQSRGRLG